MIINPYEGFTTENLEPYTFWLFERIMKDLEPLYDPVAGPDGQPMVVHYCTNIQGNFKYYFLLLFFILF